MWLALFVACTRPPPLTPLAEGTVRIREVALERCADPSAREREGPFRLYTEPSWEAQRVAPAIEDAPWGLSVEDLNGDGYYDIFLPNHGQDQLFLGQPDFTWTEATAALLPLEAGSLGKASAIADADGDGDLDLAVAQRGHNALLVNEGDGRMSLEPVYEFTTIEAENRHAAWGDIDGDGLPELYIASGYLPDEPDTPSPNQLYQNLGEGRFADISERLGPMALDTPANAGGFVDIDRDGDRDLYVVNDKPQAGFVSVLLVNDGQGDLSYDQNAHGLDIAVKGMGLGLGDLNGDGLDELAVSGWAEFALRMSAPDGVWYETASAVGLVTDAERVVAWGTAFVDLDLDGDLDLLVAYGPNYDEFGNIANPDENPTLQPNGLYLNEDGVFTEVSGDWGIDQPGVYRGYAVADLNRDGYPDYVVRDLIGPAKLYLSRCGEGRALTVNLRMPGPNTRALGARVRLEAGGAQLEREVFAGTTSISSSEPGELLFGLGAADRVEWLEVWWPDGEVTTLEDLRAGQTLTIERLE